MPERRGRCEVEPVQYRLLRRLEHIEKSARKALAVTAGITQEMFLHDEEKQEVVGFNLVVLGEAVTAILDRHRDFAKRHREIPWEDLRYLRNQIAHHYLEIDPAVVWKTVQVDCAAYLQKVPELQRDAVEYLKSRGIGR